MKKHCYVMLGVMAAVLIVLPSSADNTTHTPITPNTYASFQTGCVNSCLKYSSGEEHKVKLYCACSCVVGTANCENVVNKHHLQYEEQLPLYMSEIWPSADQFRACLTKAGI